MSHSLWDALRGAGSIGILHHWDADGISSAAAVISLAEGATCRNAIPAIGDYLGLRAPAEQLMGHRPDLLLGLDLSAPGEVLEEIGRAAGSTPAIWIDHHSKPPTPPEGVQLYHPEAMGLERPPSNSWFLAGLLGREPGLLGAAGACGDLGEGLPTGPWASRVQGEAARAGLTLEQLFVLTDLLDSSYRSDSPRGVIEAPRILADNLSSPLRLLEIEAWRRNKSAVDREIERILGEPVEERGDIFIKSFNSRMHLTSIVARKLALNAPRDETKAVVVANTHRREVPLYVRRGDPGIDLTPLIGIGRRSGLSAGGKPEVVGMIVPKRKIEATMEMIAEYLEAGR